MAHPLVIFGAAISAILIGRKLLAKPKKAPPGPTPPPPPTPPTPQPKEEATPADLAKACFEGGNAGQDDAAANRPKQPKPDYSAKADVQAKYATCYGATYDSFKALSTFEVKDGDKGKGYIPPPPPKGKEKKEFERGRAAGYTLGKNGGINDGVSAGVGIPAKQKNPPPLYSGTTEYRNGFVTGWGAGWNDGFKATYKPKSGGVAGVGGAGKAGVGAVGAVADDSGGGLPWDAGAAAGLPLMRANEATVRERDTSVETAGVGAVDSGPPWARHHDVGTVTQADDPGHGNPGHI